MKFLLSLLVLTALTVSGLCADAYPKGAKATDPSGFGLQDRFNELYSGTTTYKLVPYTATVTLDLASAAVQDVTLTGNVTFAATGYLAGRHTVVKLLASGGTRTLAFPAGWVFVGGAAPSSLASGKNALLSLRSFGPAATNVLVTYTVQP